MLFTGVSVALGHTPAGHQPYCGHIHNWVSDGNNWQHDAYPIFLGGGPPGYEYTKNRVRHRQYIQAKQAWIIQHTYWSGYCPN